jgi:hypothetical protein
MNAKAVRSLADAHSTQALADAIEGVIEREEDVLNFGEEDLGELLTNLMLASRVRAAMDTGVTLKAAFRAEMAKVREVVQNRPND